MRFEPHRSEIVPCSQAYVGIQCGGQAPQQGNGGLGAALFDALDLVGRHLRAPGQVSDAEAKGAALVVDSLAEGQGLADGDPLRILGLFGRGEPSGEAALGHIRPLRIRRNGTSGHTQHCRGMFSKLAPKQ